MEYKSTWHFLHGHHVPADGRLLDPGVDHLLQLNASHNRRVELEQGAETLALLRRQVAVDEREAARSKRP